MTGLDPEVDRIIEIAPHDGWRRHTPTGGRHALPAPLVNSTGLDRCRACPMRAHTNRQDQTLARDDYGGRQHTPALRAL